MYERGIRGGVEKVDVAKHKKNKSRAEGAAETNRCAKVQKLVMKEGKWAKSALDCGESCFLSHVLL